MPANLALKGVPLVTSAVVDFEAEVVRHPHHLQAMKAIGALHARYRAPDTKGLKARGLLIVGESGAGKSTVLEDYEAMYPEWRLEDVEDGRIGGIELSPRALSKLQDGNIKRVLLVELPKDPTPRSVVAAVLGALGYEPGARSNTSDIIAKITFYANELGVEIILFDEGHSLVHEDNDRTYKAAIEFLKSLLNRIGIGIVVAGLPRLLRIGNKELDGQMARRLHPAVHLRPYEWSDPNGRMTFIGIVNRMIINLGLSGSSCLGADTERNTARLYVAVGGEVGWVSKYLSQCRTLLDTRGEAAITLDLLSEVHAGFEYSQTSEAQKMDFSVDLKDMRPVSTAGIISAQDNPFTCDFDRMNTLWERRKPKPQFLEAANNGRAEDGSRRTRLRGKGPPPITAFGGRR